MREKLDDKEKEKIEAKLDNMKSKAFMTEQDEEHNKSLEKSRNKSSLSVGKTTRG